MNKLSKKTFVTSLYLISVLIKVPAIIFGGIILIALFLGGTNDEAGMLVPLIIAYCVLLFLLSKSISKIAESIEGNKKINKSLLFVSLILFAICIGGFVYLYV